MCKHLDANKPDEDKECGRCNVINVDEVRYTFQKETRKLQREIQEKRKIDSTGRSSSIHSSSANLMNDSKQKDYRLADDELSLESFPAIERRKKKA